MAGKVMNEAIPQEDYERMEKGLPPIKKPAPVVEEPTLPAVKDRLLVKDLNLDDIISVTDCKRKTHRNSQAVMFMGYEIGLKTSKGFVTGWMPESEFFIFRRMMMDKPGANVSALSL